MTYQSPEFDAFGWPACLAIDPSDCYGLDYDSAREATPRWYGVSSGNGNDGVSHTWPDYYCRCTPQQGFDLAAAAMLSEFKPAGYEWAKENMTVDGESDYTISACISGPPDDDPLEEDEGSWSDANGAWLLIDVFPVDDYDPSDGGIAYNSLVDCFDSAVLKLASE